MHILLSRHIALVLVVTFCLSACRDVGRVYFTEVNESYRNESIYTQNSKFDYCVKYRHKFQYYEVLDMHNQERGFTISYKSFGFTVSENGIIQITRVPRCPDKNMIAVDHKSVRNTDIYSDSDQKWLLRTNYGQPTIEAKQYFGVSLFDTDIISYTVVDALQNSYEIDSFKFINSVGIPFIVPKKALVISNHSVPKNGFAGQGYVVDRNLLYISIFNLQDNQKKYYQIEMDEIFELGVDKSLTLRPLKTKEYSLPRIKDSRKPFKGPNE
jgi:hypothetical protein